jgi:putative FmdB family regulatory protein
VPTYQYACTSCAEQVEKVQRFSDDPLTVCPACGGTLRKVFSPVGIVFKGSGFYRTDSRKASVVTADDKGAKDAKDAKSKGSDGGSSEKNGSSASSSDNGSTSSGGSASSDTKKSADTKSSQPAKAGSST